VEVDHWGVGAWEYLIPGHFLSLCLLPVCQEVKMSLHHTLLPPPCFPSAWSDPWAKVIPPPKVVSVRYLVRAIIKVIHMKAKKDIIENKRVIFLIVYQTCYFSYFVICHVGGAL
jgi:hypothetical protein